MEAVITADIINSRGVSPDIWLPTLKNVLNTLGEEYTTWELYRGDSIQLISTPIQALDWAILLKSTLKQVPNLDIRIAIGIGTITYRSEKVSESNGLAFIHSGEVFDALGKNTLAIKTPWEELNKVITIMLDLATLTMNDWKPAMAEIFKQQWENPETKQIDIAKALNKKQSNISYSLKKAGYEEILHTVTYYKNEIEKLCYS
ncbi:transcriptional regulator [Aquirufa salirivi]|uniref:Transcriptional regulator n=1 Tax=Aquirufa salirivi TaxID=3104729 RepID=A0ABW8RW61_9BACT